ncbi:hypothetical protein HMPREF0262_01579 [Clostridium sp. ATCC 29733]|nr:hypothetical protein HMPREF0262_01579 [Clostridium sp. ATCC 29733]
MSRCWERPGETVLSGAGGFPVPDGVCTLTPPFASHRLAILPLAKPGRVPLLGVPR